MEGCVFSHVEPVRRIPPLRFLRRQWHPGRDDLRQHRTSDNAIHRIFAMLKSIAGASVVRTPFNNDEDTNELKNKYTKEDKNIELSGGRETARCAGNSIPR